MDYNKLLEISTIAIDVILIYYALKLVAEYIIKYLDFTGILCLLIIFETILLIIALNGNISVTIKK
ncbi:MAG: hypothetical protein IJQ68_06895 [Methanobrevibacter sp.]|uniref:hypothetical protein n=1 Tax=Methanobrevibacter sp. TaxID=66852 RepID=UPI0025D0972C|nr:hypothetical protein [Methanobrevibacter sp.]MBR0271699.1 hypothetical protein [Methanobrevibacter sp.]